MTKKGFKKDDGKLLWNLLPIKEIEGVVEVLTFGAKKYSPDNWQHVDNGIERYYSALMRHLMAWRIGTSIDKETGLHHLKHAMTNLIFLLWFVNNKRGK